ncbi:MAG: hypothetical protein KDC11_09995, partial [Chitinophagaceae bacterium]|nr:hypothetical protein [Chitinophagaceae bacterium]
TYEDWAPATIMFKKAILDKIPGYNLFWDRVTSYDRYFILDIMDKFGAYYLDEYLYHVKARHDSDHRSIDLDDENALRKLISYDIYLFLKKQRKKTGTDHLNDNNIKELKKYEQKLMNNRRYIADKMRVFACIQIDHGNLKEGRKLLMNAIGIAPFYIKNYQSLFYMFKSKIRIGFASGSIMISDAFAEVECLINFDAI